MNGSRGYSQEALRRLETGTYKGRQQKYRTSEEQVKAVPKKVPALEGMTRSPSFDQTGHVDTANARRRYEQRTNYKPIGRGLDKKDADFLYKLFDQDKYSSGGNKAIAHQVKHNMWVNTSDWENKYGKSIEQIVDDYSKDYEKIAERKNKEYGRNHKVLATLGNVFRGGTVEPAIDLEATIFGQIAPNSPLTEVARNATEGYKKQKEQIKSGVTANMSDSGKGIYEAGTNLAEKGLSYLNPSAAKYLLTFGKTAENKRQQLKERGIEGKLAEVQSGITGLADAALDYAGFETLPMLKGLRESGNVGKMLAGGAAVGGGEQALTSLIDLATDRIFNRDQSINAANVRNYMAQGLSKEEAEKQAFWDDVKQVAIDTGSGAAFGTLMQLPRAAKIGLDNFARKYYADHYIIDPDDPILNDAVDTSDLNEYAQDALPQNSVPMLTDGRSNTAISGQRYAALPERQLPAIQLPGSNGTIELPDLAGQSAPNVRNRVKTVAESAPRNPRIVKPLKGTELKQAKAEKADIDKQIKALNNTIKLQEGVAKNGKNKAIRKAETEKLNAMKSDLAGLKKQKTAIDRQIKGQPTPIMELLTPEEVTRINNFKAEVRKVGNMWAGESGKEQAKRVNNALDKYIETGNQEDLREYAMELIQLQNSATESYTSKAGNVSRYSDYNDEYDLFDAGISGLDPIFAKSKELNGIGVEPEVVATSVPTSNVDVPHQIAERYASSFQDFDTYDYMDNVQEMDGIIERMAEDISTGKDLTPYIEALEENMYNAPDESISGEMQSLIDELTALQNGTDNALSSAERAALQEDSISTTPVMVNPDSVTNPNRPVSIGVVHDSKGRERFFIQERTSDNGTRPVEPGKTYSSKDEAIQALLRAEKAANSAWENSLEKVNGQNEWSSPSSAGGNSHSNSARLDSTPDEIMPQNEANVNGSEGYWLRVLGDNDFAVQEAAKANTDLDTLKQYAASNLGYDTEPAAPSNGGGANVPPENNPSNGGNQRERGMSQHMRGKGKMEVDVPEEVKDDFINDPDMYEQLSNKATSDRALQIYNDYPNDRETMFRDMLAQYDPAALPLGRLIAKDYSAAGNHAAAAQLYRDMGERLTKAGQFSQASILTMLKDDPLTAQQYAQRSIDQLNKQGRKEYGKKWNDLELTQDELDAFNEIDPGDEKALAELYDKIGQRLAREYPSTMLEKLLEGRKVAMLFNMRTMSRNFFANPPTLGMRYIADRIEALGQSAVHLIDPSFEKTQSIRSGGNGRKLATQFTKTERYQRLVNGVDEKHTVPDLKSEIIHHKQMYKGTAAERFIDRWTGNAFNSISDALYNAGKIKKNPHIKGGIQAVNSKLFNKDDIQSALETVRNATYKLLDVTDSPFVKENFVERLGSYLNAQGIKNIDDIPDEAIQIAWDEALKATYKDDSWMVKALRGVKGGIEKIPGIGKPLSQGLIPFLQAPGNIAARMVDYSPINLTKGIAQIIKGAAKKDHNTIRKGIEAAAKGLTGTGLAVLGMQLYKSGVLTGDYSEDQKEKSFQQRNGFKPWSLNVAGKYFSFDWMQPYAQTLMAGILAQQAIDNADAFDSDVLRHFGIEGSKAGRIAGAAYQSGKSAVNAWFDESPLGDLTSLFSGNYYDRDIAQNTVDVGKDFLSAMYPATLNAIAKTVDTTKRNTKDPSNRFSTFLNEQVAKVPFLSETLPAKYDTWGEEMKNADSQAEAFAQRFIVPGEYSSDSTEPLDVEIQRLFKETNDSRAFPYYAANKVGDKTLNNREVSEYQKDMGQRSKQMAQAFIDSKEYKNMSDADRVETLNTIYATSKAITERDKFGKELAQSSQYKKYVQAYDEAGGGQEGIKAVLNVFNQNAIRDKVAEETGLGKNTKAVKEIAADLAAGKTAEANQKIKEGQQTAKESARKEVVKQSADSLGIKPSQYEKVKNAAGADAEKILAKLPELKRNGINGTNAFLTYTQASKTIPNLTSGEFAKTFKAIDTSGNNGIQQKEMLAYLNANFPNISQAEAQKKYDAYILQESRTRDSDKALKKVYKDGNVWKDKY